MDLCQNLQPGLVIIDTLADTFGGNEIIRNQVRTFINGCLGLICKEIGATVILCGHPSQSGLSSGSGYSGSTAWNNSVRARLYLTKPDDEDAEPTERILSTKKQNYATSDGAIDLYWSHGMFKPVEKFGGVVGNIEKNNHEQVFLKCLDALIERKTVISDSKNSPTYAPKYMAKMPESERVKVKELERAMLSLYAKGDIVNEQYGPPSRLRFRIARKPTEDVNDDE
jgi:RecA-family ATPase